MCVYSVSYRFWLKVPAKLLLVLVPPEPVAHGVDVQRAPFACALKKSRELGNGQFSWGLLREISRPFS